MRPLLVVVAVAGVIFALAGVFWLCVVIATLLCLVGITMFLFTRLDDAIFASIPVVPPPASWGVDESKCSLFRYIPQLRGKVAWRPLGSYPTRTVAGRVTLPDGSVRRMFFKREDESNARYGGNKVRTLEFQLACAAAAAGQKTEPATFLAMGASGSNQTVAVATHVAAHPELKAQLLLCLPEEAQIENGANAYSSLSLTTLPSAWMWSALPLLLRATLFNRNNWRNMFVCPPGGANVPGAIGHVAALLEVCEALPDLQHIVLPMGSGCTTSGILLGVAIAQKLGLGLRSFKKVHSVAIHPLFSAGNAFLMRKKIVPRLVNSTAECIRSLGGPDVTGDVERLLCDHWQPVAHHAGQYGAPTPASLRARDLPVRLEADDAKLPWLCHTFSSKAMGYLAESLSNGVIAADDTVVFWCTKTLVQPGKRDDVFERTDADGHIRFMRASGINSSQDFYAHPNAIKI